MKFIFLSLTLLITLISHSVMASNCQPEPQTLTDGEFQVHLLNFNPGQNQRHILIIPPTGGTNFLDRNWRKSFCKAGFTAHILEHWTDDDEYKLDLGIHQRFYSRTQRAIGIFLKEIPANNFIGIMGTSIGGVHTAMAMGLHERLNAAFVITGGADMPTMIANSDQEVMVTAWNKRKALLNIPDKATYIKLLRENIQYEPLILPRYFEGKNLGMILASSDTTVPYANQMKLKEYWKPKTIINYSFNHFWTIVLSWFWDSNAVINFFEESASKH